MVVSSVASAQVNDAVERLNEERVGMGLNPLGKASVLRGMQAKLFSRTLPTRFKHAKNIRSKGECIAKVVSGADPIPMFKGSAPHWKILTSENIERVIMRYTRKSGYDYWVVRVY